MKPNTTLIILGLAVVTALVSLLGDESYGNLVALRESLTRQAAKNEELGERVEDLRREIHGLQKDDRALEKAARNELGMARSDEIVFVFED